MANTSAIPTSVNRVFGDFVWYVHPFPTVASTRRGNNSAGNVNLDMLLIISKLLQLSKFQVGFGIQSRWTGGHDERLHLLNQ